MNARILIALLIAAKPATAQIVARPAPGPAIPAWDKGIQPISRDSYYNAIECGKQGGARPACVFYDADLCKNEDFTLALYTPYKSVSYEVWRVVRSGQPAPTPSYGEAQRTRVTLGVTRAAGSNNAITGVAIKRGGDIVALRLACAKGVHVGEQRVEHLLRCLAQMRVRARDQPVVGELLVRRVHRLGDAVAEQDDQVARLQPQGFLVIVRMVEQ